MADLDKLSIVIEVNDGDAVSRLDKVVAKLTEIEQKAKSVGKIKPLENFNVGDLEKRLDRVESTIGSIGDKLKNISAQGIENVKEATQEATQSAEKLAEVIPNAIQGFSEGGEKGISNFTEKTKEATKSTKDLNDALDVVGAKNLAETTSQIEALNMKLDDTANKLAKELGRDEPNSGKVGGLILQYQSIQRSIDNLVQPAKEVEATFNRMDAINLANSKTELDLAREKLSQLIDKLVQYMNMGDKAGQTKIITDIQNQEAKISKMVAELQKEESAVGEVNQGLERQQNIIRGLSYAKQISELDTVQMRLQGVLEKIGKLAQDPMADRGKLASLIEQAHKYQQAMEETVNVKPKINEYAEVESRISGIALAGGKAYLSLLRFTTLPLSKVGNQLRGVAKHLQGIVKQITKMVRMRIYRLIAKQIVGGFSEGISNAYQWAKITGNELASSLDKIATSMLYLKNSIGALVSPLINSLAPAIDYVVDKFVALLNTVNQVFARLSGRSTWIKAVKVPQEFAKATDEATSSAKALEKELITILGIDEINPMEGMNDSPSGGGSGLDAAKDFGSMFTEEVAQISDKISEVFDPFVQAWERKGKGVMDAWNNALTGIDELGTAVGDSFWAVWQNGTGQKSIEHILGIVQGILNTVGNLTSGFAEAWREASRGERIVQGIWNLINRWLEAIEDITQATSEWADELDFRPILDAFGDLTEAIQPIFDMLMDISTWTWTEVVLPFASWTIEEWIPEALETIAGALETINGIAQPLKTRLKPLWEDILKPLFSAIGSLEMSRLETIEEFFATINEWGNKKINGRTIFDWLLTPLDEIQVKLYYIKEAFDDLMNGRFEELGDDLFGFINWSSSDYYLKITGQIGEVDYSKLSPQDRILMGGIARLESTEDKIPKNDKEVSGLTGILSRSTLGIGFQTVVDLIGRLTGSEKGKTWNDVIPDLTASFENHEKGLGWSDIIFGMFANIGRWEKGGSFLDEITGMFPKFSEWKTSSLFDWIVPGMTSKFDNWSTSSVFKWIISGMTAQFSKREVSDKFNPRITGMISVFSKIEKGEKFDPKIGGMVAGIISRTLSKDVLKPIDLKANITGTVSEGKYKITRAEKGGAFYGGSWHTIPQFASGGMPSHGSMFIAGENGTELVGRIGGRTEVLNQSQMASTMYSAVLGANASQNRLLEEQNTLLREMLSKQGSQRAYVTTSDLADGFRLQNMRNGRTVIPMGV